MTFSRRILLSLLFSSFASSAIAGTLAGGHAASVGTGSVLRPGRLMIGHLNARALGAGTSHYSMGVAYAKYLWPKKSGVAIVYYVIDADSDPNATAKINTAISTFNADFENIIQWVPWKSTHGPNYVDIDLSADDFSGQCEANEGYEAIPAQPMGGSTSCTVATILHEMGHIIGLWHEQQRPDRDTYVTVNYGNVIKGSWGNFEQFGDDIQLLTPYDYASVMQYPPYSFSRNGGAVIESVPAGIPLSGEGVPYTTSVDYSAADKEAVERLYGAAPTMVTVTSNPVGLQVVVDGTTITTPQQFSWDLNSSHSLSVAPGVQTLTGDIENSTTSATFYYTYGRWNDSTAQTHTIVVTPGNGSPAFPETLPQVATYSANFIELVPYTAGVYPDSSGTVAVSPLSQSYGVTDGAFFVARQQATLTATPTPSSGYSFYEFNNAPFWLPGGLGANPKTFYVPDTGNPVDTTAEFTNTPVFTVDVQPDAFNSNLWAYVDSDFWYTPKNFSSMYDSTWTQGSTHTLNVVSPLLPYSVNSEYVFSSWSDAGAESHTSAGLPASSASFVATMTPGFAPATNFSYPPCGGSGTISPSSPTGNGFYPTGQQLTFSATPDSLWTFAGWTYDLTGTATPANLTPNDESLVFANFNIVNTPLVLSSISPATANSGAAGFTLTLTGTGFASTSLVAVNGIDRTVTYVSPTELQVTVNASDVTTPGGFQVAVENYPSGWDGCAVFGYQTFMVEGPASSQTITFPALPAMAYGETPFSVSATASSGLPVSFASTTPSICTVSGTTVTLVGAQNDCTIEATQAGNNNYRAAPSVTQSGYVKRGAQTISFAALPGQMLGAAPFTVSATASSGLAVSFASTTTAVCTVSGSTVTLVAHGTCSIEATQAGNTLFAAATAVSRSFVVGKESQTISFAALPGQTYGAAPFTVSATASSGLAVSFASTTTAVCTVSGNTVTLVEHGACTIEATQAGNAYFAAATAVTRSFVISKDSQTISFAALPGQTLGAPPFTVSATASSGLAVSFVSTTSTICTMSGDTVTFVAVGTCSIEATQAGNNDYLAAATVTRSFKVTAASPTYTLPSNRVATWNPGLMSVGGVPSASWPICSSTSTPLAPLGSNQDDTAQINTAIQACPVGSVVSLGAGTFLIDPEDSGNNYVAVNKGVVLRGAGAGKTILNNPNNVPTTSTNNVNGNAKDPYALVIVGPGEWVNPDGDARCQGLTAYQTQYMQLLAANGTQGSMSVTVANGSIFSAGEYVLLDQTSGASWLPDRDGYSTSVWAGPNYSVQWMAHNPAVEYVDDPVATGKTPSAANNYATSGSGSDAACWFSRQDRPQNEMKQIASVSGNTITFTSPLTMTYSTSQYAELTTYTGGNKPVTYAGVENMTLAGGGGDAVDFTNTAYSWAKNIEVKHWYGDGVSISNSFRDELRDSYIHDASWAEPGGAGYAISLSNAASEILIENNISMITNKVMVARSSGAGSVVGYNYMDNGYIATNEAWIEIGLNASHMTGSHHVLFEGNQSFNIDSDDTHGNSTYLTFFRNYTTTIRSTFKSDYTGDTIDDASDTVAGASASIGPKRAAAAMGYSYWMNYVGNVLGKAGVATAANGYIDAATDPGNEGNNEIWMLGWNDGGTYALDPYVTSTSIRDGNWDTYLGKQTWLTTPGAAGDTIPNSLYLASAPAFFGGYTWPWVDPATGTVHTLPAQARFAAGTPNVVPN